SREGDQKMTLAELVTILMETGYPVAYSHFLYDVQAPFIVYREPESSNFHADNRVYKKIRNIDVELYTDKKDPEAEEKIEALLDANDLPYESYEIYIESEKLFQKVYQLSIS